jgi:signal recognition particle subunit SRP54
MGGVIDTTSTTFTPPSTIALGTSEAPAVIVLAGLQGSGKTTTAARLALYLKEREVDYAKATSDENSKPNGMGTITTRQPRTERKVLLAAADVYRPAAIKQLQILADSINVEVFSIDGSLDPVDIAARAVDKAKQDGYDTVLIDTAGRQVIDEELMEELRQIKSKVRPVETLLVVDAMTGQEAATLTAAFDNAVGITGAVLTKLDGDSRGGAAVSVRGVSGKPIKFVGTGEKVADLEPFYPDRMASRILGMGDVVSLVEKAAAEVSDAEALKMSQKMLESKFDFDDFMTQSRLVAKMGSFAGVAKMIPGLGGAIDGNQIKNIERRFKKSEAMINSMTKKERANPDLLITDRTARSRITRITRGSACSYEEGVNFISEFQKMRSMMSRMQKSMGGAAIPNGPAGETTLSDAFQAAGNRASRRLAKKKASGKSGGGKGFGAK